MADDDLEPELAAAFDVLDGIDPPDLADRIFGDASATAPRHGTRPVIVGPRGRGRARRSWMVGVAAAVVLFAGGLGVGVLLTRDSSDAPAPPMAPPPSASGPEGSTSSNPVHEQGDGTALVDPVVEPGGAIAAEPDGAQTTLPLADPLTDALEQFGGDVEGAPVGAATLGDATWCGAAERRTPDPDGDDLDDGARRCFLDAHLAAVPAAYVESLTTVEGDPIIVVWRSLDDGTVEVSTDSTRDHFGSGQWEVQRCGRLATTFPGGLGGGSPSRFSCTDDDRLAVVPIREPVPAWFTSREVLPLCGYAVRVQDVDIEQRECFGRAIESLQPAEFAYVVVLDEVRTARWLRITAAGELEVIEQTIDDGTDVAWQRYACYRLDAVDGVEPGYDHLPWYAGEWCAAGLDAVPPPHTTRAPQGTVSTAPPGTIRAAPPPP